MRIVQVGLGGFGRNWAAEVVPAVPEAEVVASVDIDPRSRAAAIAAGVTTPEQCFGSVEEALAATRPEAVLVTASLVGHVPAARAALEAGCHVLIEKPFAPSVAEGAELVALAEAAGRVVAVSQNYRFFPAVQQVRSMVADGSLGELHAVELDFRQLSTAREDGTPKPHHALAEPLLVDMSIHHIDLMRTVIGRPITRIDCRTWDPDWSAFVGPSEGFALIESESVMTSYRASWVSQGLRTTWAGEWRMDFADGELWWTSRGDGVDGASSDEVWLRRDGERTRVPLPTLTRTDRAGSLTEFLAAIEEGRQPHTSGQDNLQTLAATYAAVESARVRGPVEVTTDVPAGTSD